MKMKRLLACTLALLMLTACLAISVSAQDVYKDEYISLTVPVNYIKQPISLNGALTQSAFYESDADGQFTGDNFNFYIMQSNPTRMTLEDMQKDKIREQIKQSTLDGLNDEGASMGAVYDLRDVSDAFESGATLSYYKISLTADFTYNGMTAPIYQIIAMMPINDCMFGFTYTSFESMEKAEREFTSILNNTQILIEPEESGVSSGVLIIGLVVLCAVIGGIIGAIMSVRSKKKKQAAVQQAAYPYPNTQYPNGQYPNVPPQNPPCGNDPQNPQNPV